MRLNINEITVDKPVIEYREAERHRGTGDTRIDKYLILNPDCYALVVFSYLDINILNKALDFKDRKVVQDSV